jgi:LCP family protein required for cell wall assembly
MKRMRSKRARIVRWTSIAIAAVLVAGTLTVFVIVRLKFSGITHIAKIDAQHRPPRYTNALNVLLLGSDSRQGHNGAIGGRYGCNCSDTVMVAHVSPGRGKITVISIPRDTMVPYFACSPWNGLPGQQADSYNVERINGTLAAGGPECVRETVEQETGIYIDDVVELDFTGFEQVINDVGGVNVCLPFPIDNTISDAGGTGLDMKAGHHHIYGRVALQFWRTRENVADGSDIDRIARDQYFMAQLVKGVLHSGLLHSPTKMYQVLGDVANNLTTDASDTDLLHIATSLSGISTKNIAFITAPWVVYPGDPNEVEFSQPQANALFWALAHDTMLPKIAKKKAQKATGTGITATAAPLTISPSLVKVEILNGSDGTDQSTAASTALTSRGFTVVGTGYAATSDYTRTVIQYATKADLPAARTLKQQFSSVVLQANPELTPGTVQVILGSSFTGLAAPKPTSQSISGLSGSYGGIRANIRCRNSAFYGYYDQSPATPTACAC